MVDVCGGGSLVEGLVYTRCGSLLILCMCGGHSISKEIILGVLNIRTCPHVVVPGGHAVGSRNSHSGNLGLIHDTYTPNLTKAIDFDVRHSKVILVKRNNARTWSGYDNHSTAKESVR